MSTRDAKIARELRLGHPVEPALQDQLDSSPGQLGHLPIERPLDPLGTAVRARYESSALSSSRRSEDRRHVIATLGQAVQPGGRRSHVTGTLRRFRLYHAKTLSRTSVSAIPAWTGFVLKAGMAIVDGCRSARGRPAISGLRGRP